MFSQARVLCRSLLVKLEITLWFSGLLQQTAYWWYYFHYENTPIQIYRKFHYQKPKVSDTKPLIFFLFLLENIDCGYSLEPPRRGSSNECPQSMFSEAVLNEYPQSMFSSRNKKNNVYPCKPQFYYIKVGF